MLIDAYLFDWLSLLGRWLHLLTGIAWIGASFYFVWLDNHLLPPTDPELQKKGVSGELWAVHGGGFYNAQKYRVAPATLPPHLHWFKWEAYWTWLSGFFLLGLIYYAGAGVYLVDKSIADIGNTTAVLIGVGTLIAGWVVYDRLCVSPLGANERALAAVLTLLLVAAAYGLCHVFSGRGAYIHFGALLGTIMVANVFFVIIPGQRELVTAKQQGRDPDPRHGIRGKQRSVHNTYFTLPVLFVMMSNHYAMTYGHRYNWLVLVAISLAGAAIRTYFVARHKGKASLLPVAIGVILLAAVAVSIAPPKAADSPAAAQAGVPTFSRVQAILKDRCVSCHASAPTQAGFNAAPKGVMFDTPEQILAQAAQIQQQTSTRVMPLGNLTQMTDDERTAIAAWFQHGAKK
jgi:uncharacterized membrane protein